MKVLSPKSAGHLSISVSVVRQSYDAVLAIPLRVMLEPNGLYVDLAILFEY